MPSSGDVGAEDANPEEFGDELEDSEAEDSKSESSGDEEDEHRRDCGRKAGDEEDEALLSEGLETVPTAVAAAWLEMKPSEDQEKLRQCKLDIPNIAAHAPLLNQLFSGSN